MVKENEKLLVAGEENAAWLTHSDPKTGKDYSAPCPLADDNTLKNEKSRYIHVLFIFDNK